LRPQEIGKGSGRTSEGGSVIGMFKTVSYGIIGGVALVVLAMAFQGCVAGVSQSPVVVPQ